MLILRRNRGQSIVIGERAQVIVKILQEDKGVITLGIQAPKSILVDREEVYRKKEAEREAAEFFDEMTIEQGHGHVIA